MELEIVNENKKENIKNEELSNNTKFSKDIGEINNIEATPEKQQNFLETTLGKTINTALDIGLRWILPDIIENQVIEIKDTLLKNGLKDGINKSIESAVEFGKSALGIVTGNFDNISQIETVVQKGGIIDTISASIDKVVNYTMKKDFIPSNIGSVIKNSKNVLLNNIQTNLEKTMTNQLKSIEKVDKYITNWNTALKQKDFEKMEQAYQNLKDNLQELIPLENTLKKARELENMHLLIKNKGKDFNISTEEIELAKKLA